MTPYATLAACLARSRPAESSALHKGSRDDNKVVVRSTVTFSGSSIPIVGMSDPAITRAPPAAQGMEAKIRETRKKADRGKRDYS